MDDASDTSPFAALTDGLPTATRAQWETLAEKALKGASLDTLQRPLFDGVILQPLYGLGDTEPAQPPKLRTAWDIRAEISQTPDAAGQALEALAGGATSLLLDARDGGQRLATTLANVLLDLAPVALDAGFAGPAAAQALSTAAKASPAAPLAFHLDPLGALAQSGASPGPIASHVTEAARAAATLGVAHPRASLFLASGVVVHEAGGSPAQELAFALACAVAYARALTDAGLRMQQAWSGVVLGLTAEAQPMTAIAKLRAARRLWERASEACGASGCAQLQVRSSRRMLTRADPATNLVRLTSAGFSAVVGGADAIVLDPFDDAVTAEPSTLARRQARNIQLILAEESGLRGAANPAAGSWALEALTEQTARAAWTQFQEIERLGGAAAALISGHVASGVEAAREDLRMRLAGRSLRLVGVTDFVSGEAQGPRIIRSPAAGWESARLAGLDTHCPPLTPTRLEGLTA